MENKYICTEDANGSMTITRIDSHGQPIKHATYGEIFNAFRKQYPGIIVSDYRPADSIPDAIIVWTDHGTLLVQYQESFDIAFILANKPKT